MDSRYGLVFRRFTYSSRRTSLYSLPWLQEDLNIFLLVHYVDGMKVSSSIRLFSLRYTDYVTGHG